MSTISCKKCGQSNPSSANTCSKCGARFTSETSPRIGPETIAPGQVIANRYVVEKMIGKGGMGCIFQVHDNTLDETVALKTLLPEYVKEKAVVERFFNEARIARGLSHPNIVRVHDIGSTEGMVYISMEMLPGRTLRSMLDKVQPGRRIPLNAILRMFDALCAALDYAHSFTIHRDIKPENVMVLPDGAVKLMDFGISKLMSNPNLTSASMVMGTPHYMSPEQLKNSAKVDSRADIYSVGVMLYEALTGSVPTGISQHQDTVRDVPASLDPIIAKCCDKDPAKRYQSAGELRGALRKIREQVETKPPEPTPKPERRFPSAGTLLKRLAAVILLGAVGAVAYSLWGVAEARRIVNAERAANTITTPQPTGAAPPVSQPDAPETFETMRPVLRRAKSHAESAIFDLEGHPRHAQAQKMYEDAEALTASAEDALSSGEPDLALAQGWKSLHRYLGILHGPEDMVFVPGGATMVPENGRLVERDVDAFFVDARQVSALDFDRFRLDESWRFPTEVDPGPAPITYVSYFDAMGYLNLYVGDRMLPTPAQWSRALDERLLVYTAAADIDDDDDEFVRSATMEWIGEPIPELMRAEFSGPDVQDRFGQPVPVLGVMQNTLGELQPAETPIRLRYEEKHRYVTFRGVWELPKSLPKAEQMLREANL